VVHSTPLVAPKSFHKNAAGIAAATGFGRPAVFGQGTLYFVTS
jgi:hypothetical protein